MNNSVIFESDWIKVISIAPNEFGFYRADWWMPNISPTGQEWS